MTVNQMPVLCTNCAYTFNQTLSVSVTSVQLNGYSLAFQLSNPNAIPFTLSDIQASFLGVACIIKSGSITNFACYFPNNTDGNSLIPSGSGIPVVHIKQVGYAKINASITVAIVITSFYPSVAGPEGNISASIFGSGFPASNLNGEIVISLCGNEVVNYESFSNNEIDFLIPPEGSTCANHSSFIKINSVTFALTFNYDATISPLVSGLSLSSASPILKQNLQITGSNFESTDYIQVFLYDTAGVQQY